ncbi:amino acid adenylation domain-containing protein [Lentzea sp. NPDC051838]|uniref:amino acid adenylation domain-containing protein n=1 Tax=Lentzea sp. NPDC051838 TaxID=3154849 RepID=UPI003429CAEA
MNTADMSGEHHPLLEELFLEQVENCPDALALVDGGVRLTYRELYRRASGIAAGLVSRGVGRESIVALAFERSADAIVATLAIVLAGGAYLPLNPRFPAERLAHMINNSGTELAICGPGIVLDGVATVALDELYTDGPAPAVTPWDGSPLAYVMYTSGSTGRPKGVLVEQAGIVRLVKDSDFFQFDSDERLLLTGALEFDAATFEIWGCLLNGATLHVAGKETLLVPETLRKSLQDNEITVMWLTAPLFGQIAEHDATVFAGLRTLLVGGDVVHRRHVAKLHERFPELRIINGYGPTENTTFTTTYEIPTGGEGAIPIGRPLNQTTVAVLDERRRPVEPGQQGELYTGGAGLARGYLNNPELTAEKFVVIRGERFYRTGDRVSVDAEGLVRFHGRVDDQVKIRGHRVEVKETESVLLACQGVVDGCVVVHSDDTGKFLSAYVVLAPDNGLSDVTAELAAKLPEYMRPEHLVAMDHLPLNPNGKVDKAKLPAPQVEEHAQDHLPRHQRELALLWAEVLRVGRIEPDDDFFALGGNSLAVGALLGRLAARHGVRLPFAEVFENRTLAAMATAIRHASTVALAPIEAVAGPAVPHPQQRGLVTHWQIDEKSLAYNVPVRLDISGPVTARRVREAVNELVDRHDALRTRFVDGRQVVENTSVELVESQYLRDEDVVRAFVRPFDLGRAPLLRALLVRVDHARHRLYLDAHHVVFDGVSLRILVGQLADLLAGRPITTPKWRYADAAHWHAAQVADGRYWLEALANPPVLDLPTDYERPKVRQTRGAIVRATCSHDQVKRIADQAGTTEFVALLTAYTAVLMRLSGQHDVVVGSPTSGRLHPEFDDVVGMFVNTAALRLTVDEQASLSDLRRAVAARHAEALEHQAFPFDDVVAGLALPRDPARLPLLDAFFAWQNVDFYSFERDGLRVEVDLLHPGSCRFDLNLQAYQRPEGVVLELEHNTSLYTAASADYLLSRVVDLLTELDETPDHPVFRQPASVAATTTHADFSF